MLLGKDPDRAMLAAYSLGELARPLHADGEEGEPGAPELAEAPAFMATLSDGGPGTTPAREFTGSAANARCGAGGPLTAPPDSGGAHRVCGVHFFAPKSYWWLLRTRVTLVNLLHPTVSGGHVIHPCTMV